MPAPKDELVAAMQSIADCLAFMRGPRGEVIFLTDDKRVAIAFHLARAGLPPADPTRAVIKRRVLPDQPGRFAGSVDWIPADAEDPDPQRTAANSAVGDVDLEAMWDAVPWHVQTKIEGNFA